jgi:hypothetical protein
VFSKRNAAVVLCVWLALVPGCRYPTQRFVDLNLAHEVSPQPPRVGQVTITLTLTDGSGKLLSGARIRLEGNMSHPGMAPVFADASETDPGHYRARMDLSMAGDWYVIARVSLPNGRRLDEQFELNGVMPA